MTNLNDIFPFTCICYLLSFVRNETKGNILNSMDIRIDTDYLHKEDYLTESVLKYDSNKNILFENSRNQIKTDKLDEIKIAIKSFKIPNCFNRIVYKYFRKSKAMRSYENGKFLLQNHIGTPKPIACFNNYNAVGLLDTYYISEYLEVDLTLGELINNKSYPDRDLILRQFTQFTYRLHQIGVEFLDHSGGNTLIRKTSTGVYDFFLVDLNRMRFHKNLSFDKRMRNLRRLTPEKEIIRIISNEYSKLSGENEFLIYKKISTYAANSHQKSNVKKRFKAFLSL